MSLLTHRCSRCGHPDFWRDLRSVAQLAEHRCPCGCPCEQTSPAELAPTWDQAGRRIAQLAEPGARLAAGAITTCSCPQCQALYEQLTSITPTETAAPAEPHSTATPSTRQLRKWAAEHHIPCPARGRIPRSVTEAYQAAHEHSAAAAGGRR